MPPKERLWEYVQENPGCGSCDIQRLWRRFTMAEILGFIAEIAKEGKVVYRIKGKATKGRRGYAFYTEEQLKARRLWPIPEDRRIDV